MQLPQNSALEMVKKVQKERNLKRCTGEIQN